MLLLASCAIIGPVSAKTNGLSYIWDKLNPLQRLYLIARWGGHAKSDRDAVLVMLAAQEKRREGRPEAGHEYDNISFSAIWKWKQSPPFRAAYQLAQDRFLFAQVIAREGTIEQLQLALREQRIILETPWSKCTTGQSAAKSRAIEFTLKAAGGTSEPAGRLSRSNRGNIFTRVQEGEAEP